MQVLRCPPDALLSGPNGANLASQSVSAHPVQQLQERGDTAFAGDKELLDARKIYGVGFAMGLATERFLVGECGERLPGMDATPQTNVLLETLKGTDTSLDFEDTLNRKENRVEAPRLSLHQAMESKLGL